MSRALQSLSARARRCAPRRARPGRARRARRRADDEPELDLDVEPRARPVLRAARRRRPARAGGRTGGAADDDRRRRARGSRPASTPSWASAGRRRDAASARSSRVMARGEEVDVVGDGERQHGRGAVERRELARAPSAAIASPSSRARRRPSAISAFRAGSRERGGRARRRRRARPRRARRRSIAPRRSARRSRGAAPPAAQRRYPVTVTRWRMPAARAPGPRATSTRSRVVERLRQAREPQRAERVPHHRELVGPRRADRALDEARLRAVRQAARVQRDRPDVDALARAELPST